MKFILTNFPNINENAEPTLANENKIDMLLSDYEPNIYESDEN